MKASELEQIAQELGTDFFNRYLDTRLDEATKLKPAEAFFAAWSLLLPSERPERLRTQDQVADLLGYTSQRTLIKWKKRDWYHDLVEKARRNRVLHHLRSKADSRLDTLLDSEDERIVLGASKLVYEEARHLLKQHSEAGDVENDWWEAA